MATRHFLIPRNSNVANAIREEYDRLIDIQQELEKAGESLAKPELTMQHIMKANNYASRATRDLLATDAITNDQLPSNN